MILAEAERACASVVRWVCGRNGRSYQNSCKAKRKGVRVKHLGRCRRSADIEDYDFDVDAVSAAVTVSLHCYMFCSIYKSFCASSCLALH